ncbi:MAG: TRC40/GET3/ArsA family transport-energizing ATPase [Halapricum sp.]
MTDIDVEPVEEIADDAVPTGVEAPDYVLYGGKGGVGKTTMAAATGLASARDGTSTLIVSTDPAHSLSDTLETDIPSQPAQIREDVPLYAVEIDPENAFGDNPLGVEDSLGPLTELLGDDMADPFGAAMPGTDEAAAMRLLLQYLDDERFDRVVVDTAPTGHTLRLLELPDVMETMIGRLVAFRERMSGVMESVTGMFGSDDEDVEEGISDLRELSQRIERLRAVLQDPRKTDFRVVLVPEELSVMESERLLTQLDEFGIPVGTIVVNRVMEDLTDVAGIDADWFVAPNLDHCEFCQRRWEVQQTALQRSQDIFRGHDVKRVPLFADEVRGENLLKAVAACLD